MNLIAATTLVAVLFGAASHASALPPMVIRNDKSLNITEWLSKRDDNWCYIFYSGLNCGGNLVDTACGTGPYPGCIDRGWFMSLRFAAPSNLKLVTSYFNDCSIGDLEYPGGDSSCQSEIDPVLPDFSWAAATVTER